MPESARQELTGIVVNRGLGVSRRERDRLKALLHRCVCGDWREENVEGHADFLAHLAGRVAWVEHVQPHHGARLRALLEAIPRAGAPDRVAAP